MAARSSAPVYGAAAAVRGLASSSGRLSLCFPDDEASCCGWRGPALRAARSRLTALVVSAGHMPGPAGQAGAAASFRLRYAARPALAVLAWSGDGSPVWGCTTTSGVQVPPRTHGGLKSLGTQAPGFGGCLRARPRHRARAPLDPRASNAVTSTWRECRHDHLDTAPLNQLGQGNDAQRPGSSNPAPFKPGSASTSPSRSAVRLSLCRTPTRR